MTLRSPRSTLFPYTTLFRSLTKGISLRLRETLLAFKRQALHARTLGLIHPDTEEWCQWEAPLPADFLELRSEEHTSELQSRPHLVCRLLLEKKNRGDAEIRHVDSVVGETAVVFGTRIDVPVLPHPDV